jgi:hypothetical protein
MDDYVTIGNFSGLTEAQEVEGMLAASGLSPRTRDEYASGLLWLYIPAMAGVRVEVPAEQEREARDLLESMEVVSVPSAEDREYARKMGRRRRIYGLIALFFVTPWFALLGLFLGRRGLRRGKSAG